MRIEKILAPVDFSPGSYAALEKALELGQRLGAMVDVLYVHAAGEDALARMDTMISWLARRGFTPGSRIEQGDPATVIVRTALDDGYHLIVMGTHGDGASPSTIGRVATRVVEISPVPVLTIRLSSPAIVVAQ